MGIRVIHGGGSSISLGEEIASGIETGAKAEMLIEKMRRDRQAFELAQQIEQENLQRLRLMNQRLAGDIEFQDKVEPFRLQQEQAGARISEADAKVAEGTADLKIRQARQRAELGGQQVEAGRRALDRDRERSDALMKAALSMGLSEDEARALVAGWGTLEDAYAVQRVRKADQEMGQRIAAAQNVIGTVLGPSVQVGEDGSPAPGSEQAARIVEALRQMAAFDPEGAMQQAFAIYREQNQQQADISSRQQIAEATTAATMPILEKDPKLAAEFQTLTARYLHGLIDLPSYDERVSALKWIATTNIADVATQWQQDYPASFDPSHLMQLMEIWRGVRDGALTAKQASDTIAAMQVRIEKEQNDRERLAMSAVDQREVHITEDVLDEDDKPIEYGKVSLPAYAFADFWDAGEITDDDLRRIMEVYVPIARRIAETTREYRRGDDQKKMEILGDTVSMLMKKYGGFTLSKRRSIDNGVLRRDGQKQE